jgi:hypothetical protein
MRDLQLSPVWVQLKLEADDGKKSTVTALCAPSAATKKGDAYASPFLFELKNTVKITPR